MIDRNGGIDDEGFINDGSGVELILGFRRVIITFEH